MRNYWRTKKKKKETKQNNEEQPYIFCISKRAAFSPCKTKNLRALFTKYAMISSKYWKVFRSCMLHVKLKISRTIFSSDCGCLKIYIISHYINYHKNEFISKFLTANLTAKYQYLFFFIIFVSIFVFIFLNGVSLIQRILINSL